MAEMVDVVWVQSGADASFEHLSLEVTDRAVIAEGTVIGVDGPAPLRVDYRVECDSQWRTVRCNVREHWHGRASSLLLEHDGAGIWTIDGVRAEEIDGCTDVDLGVSPSTNALPIRRLALREGQEAEIKAAWILVPRLKVVPSLQSYRRLAGNRYLFRSVESGFEAELAVDHLGLPLSYGAIWSRVAGFDQGSPG